MKRHLVCAAIAALLFGLPLLWSLQTAIPYRVRTTLAPDAAGEFAAVDLPELLYLRTSDGQSTYRIRLDVVAPDNLLRNHEIDLRLTDYGQTRTILSADITIPSANCSYAAQSGQVLPRNAFLLFIGRERCADVSHATKAEAFLTIRLNKPGKPAVWTVEHTKGTPSETAVLIADRTRAYFSGRGLTGAVGYTDPSRTATRLTLLAYVWQLPRESLALIMFGAVALIGLSSAIVSGCCGRPNNMGRGRSQLSWCAALAAALALAVVYACIVPPFQAADETHHFIGLVDFLGRPELGSGATRLEQLGHHDRIAFHPDEHFNTSDVGRAGIILVTGVSPEWDLRGRGIFIIWRAFAPLLRHTGTASGLLILARVLNAAVFSIAIGLFVWILESCSPSRPPILDTFPLFIIPALPFFGMYVSNYAPLCALYVVFGAAIVLLAWDSRLSYIAGPLMGVSWALATLLSRSALPLAPVPVSCAIARMVLGPSHRTRSGELIFWLGLTIPTAIALEAIPHELFGALQSMAADLPAAIRPFWEVIRHPWIIVPFGLIAWAIEVRVHGRDTQTAGGSFERGARSIAVMGYTAAALVGTSIALSAFVAYPTSPGIDPQHPPSAASYIGRMVLAAATMFRFGPADFLTSRTFWSGFGWLDTPLPDWLVATLTVTTGLALVHTFVWIARTRASRTAVLYVLLFAGLLTAFMATSYTGLRSIPGGAHGRYLLGIYICLLLLCWHGLARVSRGMSWSSRAALCAACGICVVAIHAVAFTTILSRYFA